LTTDCAAKPQVLRVNVVGKSSIRRALKMEFTGSPFRSPAAGFLPAEIGVYRCAILQPVLPSPE
jgi:hypothetical protein